MSTFPPPTFIETNGVSLEVFQAGSGKPIVMCHGFPEHAYSWRHQIDPLVEAGYHVIVPSQRGYGNSTAPEAVVDYDIVQLTADLAGLLDHYGYDDALFVGHDWGAIVVWNMALLHPQRVAGVINLSVPFMPRGTMDWISLWEQFLGPDFYMVHFNRQPGVADAVFDANTENFLRNMYRTRHWLEAPPELGEGMALLNVATADSMPGDLLMSEEDLQVFVTAFEHSGFTGGINWYRNLSRNWQLLEAAPEQVLCPALMIHGDHDMVPPLENLAEFVPQVEVVSLECGHWIMQEEPQKTTDLIKQWLLQHYPA
ncbi:alpha/beta hydrolase [Halieaceae bacterium IMCC14734]|uniref:Alpha/beta hydrolase n=1 Tax=Candidatus Litorirhabdus singularis TaxID=2518993 RepID=A0ABT3TED0_9GAMM|nr:alpha/beta hydrolase [Candidatus Litorirhabdus singularis]MCX2980668.1 alpha/beta hydrolase [Candidatus Litorirhabdus singularis]